MGFSFPEGLLSLAFLAVLVWIWLRERRQRALDVPSLLLWEAVRQESRRNRFRADPLFLLQAALLAALAFALAKPYREEAAAVSLARSVLVFDTSASMQTVEAGERRFDLARRKARELIAALDPGDEVMVIAVEAKPRVVMAFTRDRQLVGKAVESLEPGDGPSRLSLGIQLARSAGAAGDEGTLRIVVFTDLPRQDLTAPLGRGESLRYFRFGTNDDNVALAAFRVDQNPFQPPAEARAYTLVKNYARRDKDVELHVALDGREIASHAVHLGPREGRVVAFRDLPGAGSLVARIDVSDALSVDNRALAFVRPSREVRLLAVTESPELFADLGAIAGAIPSVHLERISPGSIEDLRPEKADVVLFHATAPRGALPANALFVYPPRDNPYFPTGREVVGAQILDWNERDAILRDLRYVESIPLGRARMMSLPAWAHTLIASRAGAEEFPLAFAGEIAGRRVVCFGFDLAGHSLRKSENLSLLLLVLNAIRWLAPLDPRWPVQVEVGDRYRETLAEAAAVSVSSPDGAVEQRAAAREVGIEIDRRGEYRLRIGSAERMILGNLFDPEESDVGRQGAPSEESFEEGTASRVRLTARLLRDYGPWLYRLGLLLLFVEWLYALGRRRVVDGTA